jgi:hypothetical protein
VRHIAAKTEHVGDELRPSVARRVSERAKTAESARVDAISLSEKRR